MKVSEPFIRAPIATSLLMLGVLVLGMATFRLLPLAALPNVDFPTIRVQAKLPGASPDTMASSVATPLEQQFGAVPGLSQMTSTSGLGATTITLQFDLSRDIDGAASDVQSAINAAEGLLPKNLPTPPTYKKTNPADRPILIYAVHSDALPIYRVDDFAYTVLAQKISQVPGVADVNIAGEQIYAPHIQINPLSLAAKGIAIDDVRTALTSAALDSAKGTLEGEHQTLTLDTNDQINDAEGFRNVIVTYRNGAPVAIKDIGDVIDSSSTNRVGAWFGDERAELLLVERQPGSNTVAVVNQIKAMMPRLEASIPPSVHVDLVSDRSETISASVSDVEFTLMLTIGLVVLVIFIFLRKAWATIIPAVTVPISLAGTFGVMYLLGYNLDNLSLMGLTIAVGFVVDDAIVMIENIVRYIEDGDTPFDAAIKGAGQIGFTIISITFSLIAVFIPLLFMQGIVGRLFHEFAMTVATAVVVSALVSLTLTPVMCSRFLRHEAPNEKHGRLYEMMERFFDRVLHGYDRGLHWVFRHQLLMLMSTLGLIVVTGYLYITIPKGFFPQQDTGFISGQVQARQDISFAGMTKVVHQVADIVRKDPAVHAVVEFAGATGGNSTESTARMMIQLKSFGDRNVSVQQVIQRLRPKMLQVVGAKVFFQAGQDVTIGGRVSQAQYQYTLSDTNTDELNEWAPKIQQGMQQIKVLQDVATDQQIASPHVTIDIDRNTASRLGISLQTIDNTLYDAFGQSQIGTIYAPTNQYKVILEAQPQFQDTPDALERIYVPNSAGGQVPLSAIAHFGTKVEPLTVNHQGQFPAVTLSFNLAPGASLSQAVDEIQAMQDKLHVPQTLQGSFQGTAQAFQDSLTSTPLLVAAAIFVVYIVLGMLYESYIHPITILSALPSAGVGALIMLMATGYDLDVIGLIGIILLIGIVKKNAIMMIDFALEAERDEGLSPQASIHKACILRFRPIMMTTFCALFAGLPLAVGTGAGSELRRPMGIAIVGGLLVSQVLTLYTTPVIYLYLDRAARWVSTKFRRKRMPQPAAVGE